MSQRISVSQCLQEVAQNKDFLKQIDRLTGANLSRKGAPIELLIDEATSREKLDIQTLIHFVYQYVWLTLKPSLRGQLDVTIIPLKSPEIATRSA